MCMPKTRGGQRCASATAKALTSASSRLERTVGRYHRAVESDASPAMRAELRGRALQADHAFEDALIEHATTPTGRAEVEALRDAAPLVLTDAENTRTRSFYDNVLTSADYMRKVRADVKKLEGFVAPRHMEAIEWPRAYERDLRAQQIETAKARELKAARPAVNLPAGVEAADGERITDIYFCCENHRKPGECTAECAELVSMMSPEDGVDFDETGTTYGPPKPYTGYHYDETQRASIAVTYTPKG